MGKFKGSKNVMRTPKEKEAIVLEFYEGNIGRNEICRKYSISVETLRNWRFQYDEKGIEGLVSQTGKKIGGTKGQGARKPKNEEERLKREIAKLEIEVARLKKGYQVKGVGAQKEYVTTFDVNTK